MAVFQESSVGAVRWLALVALIQGCSSQPRLTLEAECVRTLDFGGGAMMALAFSPDGKILAAGGLSSPFGLWDVASGQKVAALPLAPDGSVSDLSFSPDGKTLAAADGDNTVDLWDVASRKEKAAPDFPPERLLPFR